LVVAVNRLFYGDNLDVLREHLKTMKAALAAAVLTVALAGCSGSEAGAEGGPTPATGMPNGESPPATVTKTAQAVPGACLQAFSAAHELIRRAEYYPVLVAAAAQSERYPRRLLAETRSLTRELTDLKKEFTRARSRCLD
jgi:hypothetical protein